MADFCDISYKNWPLTAAVRDKVCALLESWALDPTVIPASAADRRKALVDAGLEIKDNITNVDIHRMVEPDHDASGATLNLVLPVPCQLAKRHKLIDDGNAYGLPAPFTDWVKGDPGLPATKSPAENRDFYKKYFCEYVLQHCG
jgi:hypothetical protein